jgi:hypothetical protein
MANTTNFGWETPDDTDLVKDGAAAMRTLGSAIDTSMMDLKGGTSGQVLSKNSNTDMDFVWVTSDDANAIQNAIVDAKGDLITATAADTPARLAVGTVNGQFLKVDSSTSTGLAWGSVGNVLQVVSSEKTSFQSIKTASATDITGMSVTITPSSTSNKILIIGMLNANVSTSTGQMVNLALVNGSNTRLFTVRNLSIVQSAYGAIDIPFVFVHSPSTTSAVTYKLRVTNDTSAEGVTIANGDANFPNNHIVAMEIGA